MKIYSRFKKLSVWNKVGVIGSIASIAGLLIAFSIPDDEGETNNISTSGNYSPVIKSEGSVSYSVNITNQEKANPDLEKPKYVGRWDSKKAFSLAWPTPRKPQYKDGHEDRFEKDFFISISGIDKRIILTTYYRIPVLLVDN